VLFSPSLLRRQRQDRRHRHHVFLKEFRIRPASGQTEPVNYSERYDYEYVLRATGLNSWPRCQFNDIEKGLESPDMLVYPVA
jgi:hypothetical protein